MKTKILSEADYQEFLKTAPPQESDEFLDFLRNGPSETIYEDNQWLVIRNIKNAGWLTAFAKVEDSSLDWFRIVANMNDWSHLEWRKHSRKDQSVPGRFHIHILPD